MLGKVSGICAFEDCEKPAEFIACGRESYDEDRPGHFKPACYCREHMAEVIDERSPEYTAECPNCKCMFGVN